MGIVAGKNEKSAASCAECSCAVTCSRNAGAKLSALAHRVAARLGAEYFARPDNFELAELLRERGVTALVVVTQKGLRLVTETGMFTYHPGMGTVRLKNLLTGDRSCERDHFIEAVQLRPGMRYLDGTLGLAGDALIASHIVGSEGLVVGLEASRLIHLAVSYGLKHYSSKLPELAFALRRIKAIHAQALPYLKTLPSDSFDVVYLDPMFRFPVKKSVGIAALRPLAYAEPLTREIIAEALRVAPRVVVKERREKYLRVLGCTEFVGGNYSSFCYGVALRRVASCNYC